MRGGDDGGVKDFERGWREVRDGDEASREGEYVLLLSVGGRTRAPWERPWRQLGKACVAPPEAAQETDKLLCERTINELVGNGPKACLTSSEVLALPSYHI